MLARRRVHRQRAHLRRDGWVHHSPRLMVLGDYAPQRGIDPPAMADRFHRSFVDGYDWLMPTSSA